MIVYLLEVVKRNLKSFRIFSPDGALLSRVFFHDYYFNAFCLVELGPNKLLRKLYVTLKIYDLLNVSIDNSHRLFQWDTESESPSA